MKKILTKYNFLKNWLLFFLLIIAIPSFGQEKDFGIWTNFELGKKLSKRFDIEAELGHRLKNNLTQRDESFLGIGLSYSKKRFGATLGYRFTNEYSLKRTYDLAHRLAFQINYKPKIKRFTVNYRVRVQAQYSAVNSTPDGHLPVSFLRNRLKLSYNVKSIPLEPSISFELFTRINKYTSWGNERERFIFSLKYEIINNNEVEVSVIRHSTFNVNNPMQLTVIGIGYNLSI